MGVDGAQGIDLIKNEGVGDGVLEAVLEELTQELSRADVRLSGLGEKAIGATLRDHEHQLSSVLDWNRKGDLFRHADLLWRYVDHKDPILFSKATPGREEFDRY